MISTPSTSGKNSMHSEKSAWINLIPSTLTTSSGVVTRITCSFEEHSFDRNGVPTLPVPPVTRIFISKRLASSTLCSVQVRYTRSTSLKRQTIQSGCDERVARKPAHCATSSNQNGRDDRTSAPGTKAPSRFMDSNIFANLCRSDSLSLPSPLNNFSWTAHPGPARMFDAS
jgi:hypothetical protein